MKIYKISQESQVSQEEYKGSHEAPVPEVGSSLDNLTNIFPDDIYSYDAVRLYSTGMGSMDYESISIIQACRNRPRKQIRVYRAVPMMNKEINNEIKELNKIISYYNKFNFYPTGYDTVLDSFKAKYGELTGEANRKMQDDVYDDIIRRIDELKAQRQPELKINVGDWVTLSRSYAKSHGESNLDGYRIVSKAVTASQLYTDGDIHEWGYYP